MVAVILPRLRASIGVTHSYSIRLFLCALGTYIYIFIFVCVDVFVPTQVPDYYDVIKHPMDLSTMKKKVEENAYSTLNDFEKDFYLVWHNATIYNHKDTIYYRAAIRVKEAGVCVCVCQVYVAILIRKMSF